MMRNMVQIQDEQRSVQKRERETDRVRVTESERHTEKQSVCVGRRGGGGETDRKRERGGD